jgi:hypothetical protein
MHRLPAHDDDALLFPQQSRSLWDKGEQKETRVSRVREHRSHSHLKMAPVVGKLH